MSNLDKAIKASLASAKENEKRRLEMSNLEKALAASLISAKDEEELQKVMKKSLGEGTSSSSSSSSSSMPDVSTLELLNSWIGSRNKILNSSPNIMYTEDDVNESKLYGGVSADPPLVKHFMTMPSSYNKKAPSLQLVPGKTVESSIPFLGLNEYHMVRNSGGGKNDCLIISFLMGVSPNYRKLSYPNKYVVSDLFRRQLLVPLLQRNFPGRMTQPVVQLFKSTQFLNDTCIGLLADQYRLNILNMEGFKQYTVSGLGRVYMPPSITLAENPAGIPYPNGIIIYNRGGGHFEIVYKGNIKGPRQYIFTYDELQELYRRIQDNLPFVGSRQEGFNADSLAGLEEGTMVIIKDKRYKVLQRVLDGPDVVKGYWVSKDFSKTGENVIHVSGNENKSNGLMEARGIQYYPANQVQPALNASGATQTMTPKAYAGLRSAFKRGGRRTRRNRSFRYRRNTPKFNR